MNEQFEEKVEELYNILMDKYFKVLNIFNDFFGEERVDMQGMLSLDKFKYRIKQIPLYLYGISRLMTNTSLSKGELAKYEYATISDIYYNENLSDENIKQIIIDSFTDSRIQKRIIDAISNETFIIIHFPHVKVTNEHNRFVDINHLWAKININYDGTLEGTFGLNRSEYTLLHMRSNYLHSHVSYIPVNNFTVFMNPCLGTGPIRDTITSLNANYDEDIWKLFCLELSKYVTVESLAGVPYKYLEKIGTEDVGCGFNRFTPYFIDAHTSLGYITKKYKGFIKKLILSKKLKFSYIDGAYAIGMSFVEFMVLISNEFIDWYNEEFNKGESDVNLSLNQLIQNKILFKGIVNNGKIYYYGTRTPASDFTAYIGKKVCRFKGRDITINITDIKKPDNSNVSLFLNSQCALHILTEILRVLNYRYGRNTENTDAQTDTAVRYI